MSSFLRLLSQVITDAEMLCSPDQANSARIKSNIVQVTAHSCSDYHVAVAVAAGVAVAVAVAVVRRSRKDYYWLTGLDNFGKLVVADFDKRDSVGLAAAVAENKVVAAGARAMERSTAVAEG